MLTVKNFSKRFNDQLILEIAHLELSKGVYWIKGENGSGKTTLFKSMAGIIPFDGAIFLSPGVEVNTNPLAYRKGVNYSEAEPNYPGFLTAKDLIRFVGKTKNETIEKQNYYAQHFGVNAFFDKPCETYSSGMIKKLSLTMAFFGNPSLIILDEPLITLDDGSRHLLYDLIRQRIQQSNTTFLISSHQSISTSDLEIADTYRILDKKLVLL
jgi:ABC-2 type transport system ATP-binding protein